MKLKIMHHDGNEKGTVSMPEQFDEPVRQDIIKRAVIAIQQNNRNQYGSLETAGKRASAYVSKRRRDYKTTYGIGQSRTPRKSMSKNGSRLGWVGAFAPQTVGGRRSHPPKPWKDWTQKINESENRKAIRSALAATMQKDIVKARGHKVPDDYPFILSQEFEKVTKTKDLRKTLEKLGFVEELERATKTKIRAGKGKLRGRKHVTKRSILFVTAQDCSLLRAANNLQGTATAIVTELNAEILAPGTEPGRITLFTESAIKRLAEEKLYTKDYKGPSKEQKAEPKKEEKKEKPKAEKKPAAKKTAKKKSE